MSFHVQQLSAIYMVLLFVCSKVFLIVISETWTTLVAAVEDGIWVEVVVSAAKLNWSHEIDFTSRFTLSVVTYNCIHGVFCLLLA